MKQLITPLSLSLAEDVEIRQTDIILPLLLQTPDNLSILHYLKIIESKIDNINIDKYKNLVQ